MESSLSGHVTQRSTAQVAGLGGTALLVCSGCLGEGAGRKQSKQMHKMEHWLSSEEVRKARNIKGEEEEGG